jgi:hypothetical protein
MPKHFVSKFFMVSQNFIGGWQQKAADIKLLPCYFPKYLAKVFPPIEYPHAKRFLF